MATFDRHPLEILRPEAAPPYLTPLDEKLDLLEKAGVDLCVLLRLDDGVLAWTAEEFVRRTFLECVRARAVVAGPDFQYGRGRAGTLETLREDGAVHGFDVEVMPPVLVEGMRVSSYAVREALEKGDLETARALLGRPYSVAGTVVSGRRLGRELGFPTANIAFEQPVALPANGIYAVRAEWDGESHPAVASLGVRPTVENGPAPRLLEVYVMDWSGDLYGRRFNTTFIQRLREERRFDGLNALKQQIARDVQDARAMLG